MGSMRKLSTSFIKHCPLLAYENCLCASAVGIRGAGYGLRIHTCSYLSCHLDRHVSRQNATKPWAVSEGLSFKFWKQHLNLALIYISKVTHWSSWISLPTRFIRHQEGFFSTKLEFFTGWDFGLTVLVHQESLFLIKDMNVCRSWRWVQRVQKSFLLWCLYSHIWRRTVHWQKLPKSLQGIY